jgi:monofunctional biosynthetic peptidoglycan transglycosylase
MAGRRRAGVRAALAIVCAALVGATAFATDALRGIPGQRDLRSQVVSRYTAEIARSWKPLRLISAELQESVVIWEDPEFYDHAGLSYGAIFLAVRTDLREGRFARGGSTITQQVAKNLFLTQDKTVRRKLQDAVLARRLERVLSKDEILEVYLNSAEWGDHVHGADAAARFYFDVEATHVDWPKAALLAAILPNPRLFNPCRNSAEAGRRRNVILLRLHEENRIDATQYALALATPIDVSCGEVVRSGEMAIARTP